MSETENEPEVLHPIAAPEVIHPIVAPNCRRNCRRNCRARGVHPNAASSEWVISVAPRTGTARGTHPYC